MPADPAQVLTGLLHDLRSPLGVAHGYLRLVREGRLPTDADRDRALDKARDALGRMTQMCNDANTMVASGTRAVDSSTSVAEFIDALRTQLDTEGATLVSGEIAPGARVRLHTEPAQLVDAVIGLLRASVHARPNSVVRAETGLDTLSFLRHEQNAVTDDLVVVSLPLETVSE